MDTMLEDKLNAALLERGGRARPGDRLIVGLDGAALELDGQRFELGYQVEVELPWDPAMRAGMPIRGLIGTSVNPLLVRWPRADIVPEGSLAFVEAVMEQYAAQGETVIQQTECEWSTAGIGLGGLRWPEAMRFEDGNRPTFKPVGASRIRVVSKEEE